MSGATETASRGDRFRAALRREYVGVVGLAAALVGLLQAGGVVPGVGVAVELLLAGELLAVWGSVLDDERLPVLGAAAVAVLAAANLEGVLAATGLDRLLASLGLGGLLADPLFSAVVALVALGAVAAAWLAAVGREHLWALFGLGTLLVATLQLYGPLVAVRPSVLLAVIGIGAVVWDFCLQRAGRVLAVGDRYGWHLVVAFALVAAGAKLGGLLGDYWTTVGIQVFIFGVLALSWDLVGGQTGYPSFGNMAFFGVGAYTSAILFGTYGVGLPVAFAASALAALAFAAVIGLIVFRLRGHYFAIATLGVLLASIEIARNLEITGGASGIALFDSPGQSVFYYGILATLVAEIALVRFLLDTRFGYVLNTVRDDERKAVSMGINTTYYKTAAWMIAALFTGLVGAMWAPYNLFVDPAQSFNVGWNVELIVGAFLGGSGTLAGPVLGAFGLRGLILTIESLFAGWQLVILGLVVVVTVIAFPEGVVGQLHERAGAMEYYRHGGGAAGEAADADGRPATTDGGGGKA